MSKDRGLEPLPLCSPLFDFLKAVEALVPILRLLRKLIQAYAEVFSRVNQVIRIPVYHFIVFLLDCQSNCIGFCRNEWVEQSAVPLSRLYHGNVAKSQRKQHKQR